MATETPNTLSRAFRARTAHMIAVAAVAGLAACQPTGGASTSAPQTLQVVDSQVGTITGMQEVAMDPSTLNQAGGALAGGLIGGLIGNQVGQGTGRRVATTVGALGGAAAGVAAARATNATTIPQWTVALDNGRTVAVQSNDSALRVGSRVRVQQLSNGELRIGAI